MGVIQTGVPACPVVRNVNPSTTTTYSITSASNVTCPEGIPYGGATVTVDPRCSSSYTLPPCRVADTWPLGLSGGPVLAAHKSRTFPVAGLCGVPASAKAVALNVTVVHETDIGDLRLFRAGGGAPLASTINFVPNLTRANNAVVSLGAAGRINVLCDMPPGSTGVTHLVLDVFGYFE